jgi:hypothetical protein
VEQEDKFRLYCPIECLYESGKGFDGCIWVETKIFVFVFSRKAKIYFRFSRKKLTKSYENNENFRENFRENENV